MTERKRTTVTELLAEARAGLSRLSPREAEAAIRAGALLIDIRPETNRKHEGVIAGARVIERNVFEWRCDPDSEWSDPEAVADLDRPVIVMCNEGYQSSLAAAILQRFGFAQATDMDGGFRAWRDDGLPVEEETGA